ncbi:MAG: ABC transporter permease [Candidatus Latescibacterota bacterium]|jgi:putative ABC transport system permease protein
MVFYEPVAVGLTQLRANKLRSFLTLLGIMIGVAAVIGIVSLGEGLRRTVMGEFASRGGAGTVLVNPPESHERRGGRWVRRNWQEHLTTDDLEAFYEETDRIQAAVPGVGGNVQLQYGKVSTSASLSGTSEDYTTVYSWPVDRGRNLTAEDVDQARRVCVIGGRIRQDLFDQQDPLGEEIKLNGERYTVVGVLTERIRFGQDQGNQVVIPFTTAQKRYTGNRYLMGITLLVDDLDAVEAVADVVRRVLNRRHEHGAEFRVRTSREEMESAENVLRVVKMVGGGIAGISLLVGGIGIMNIMLVSVTERTREIGVRKALGAKPRHLLFQFVAEAVVLSLAGGVLGIALGLGFGLAAEKVIHTFDATSPFVSVVSAPSVLWTLLFASTIGLFFGVYPAVRASRLDPVEALRHE